MTVALQDAKPVEAASFIHHKSGHRTPVHVWAIPLRDRHGSIIGVIQTFEAEFSVNGPNPHNRSMQERGWLDNTTGLPNHAVMQSHLREMLGAFTELQIPFGIVCVEVHEFRKFRARYGPEAATSMMQMLARTLRNTVWPTDFVGHWTEGRFLVILSGCNENTLQAVSERVLRLLASVTIRWWGEELAVAVSIGRTTAVAGDSLESILERAQQATGNRS
jgi:diguanylate cyclase (GGDEF)-like protein